MDVKTILDRAAIRSFGETSVDESERLEILDLLNEVYTEVYNEISWINYTALVMEGTYDVFIADHEFYSGFNEYVLVDRPIIHITSMKNGGIEISKDLFKNVSGSNEIFLKCKTYGLVETIYVPVNYPLDQESSESDIKIPVQYHSILLNGLLYRLDSYLGGFTSNRKFDGCERRFLELKDQLKNHLFNHKKYHVN